MPFSISQGIMVFIFIIILLFEIYSLDIKCYVNARLWLWFHLLPFIQLFLASPSGSSAFVKMVTLSATIVAFSFFCFCKFENNYLIFSTISKVAWTVKPWLGLLYGLPEFFSVFHALPSKGPYKHNPSRFVLQNRS